MAILVPAARFLHECSEVVNDRRYALRTAGFLLQAQVGVKHPDAEVYAATPYRVVRRLLRQVPSHCLSGTFIDYGCGRGRVAILSAGYGFQRVLGIDLSPTLLREAQANLETARMRRKCQVSFVQADAAEFRVPDDTRVVYFYKPFGAATTSAVLRRIRESLDRHPREFWLLGYNSDLLQSLAREHLEADLVRQGRTVYPSIPWAAMRVGDKFETGMVPTEARDAATDERTVQSERRHTPCK